MILEAFSNLDYFMILCLWYSMHSIRDLLMLSAIWDKAKCDFSIRKYLALRSDLLGYGISFQQPGQKAPRQKWCEMWLDHCWVLAGASSGHHWEKSKISMWVQLWPETHSPSPPMRGQGNNLEKTVFRDSTVESTQYPTNRALLISSLPRRTCSKSTAAAALRKV